MRRCGIAWPPQIGRIRAAPQRYRPVHVPARSGRTGRADGYPLSGCLWSRSPLQLRLHRNLALLCRVTGDPAAAQALNEQALAGLDARLTPDHHYPRAVAVNFASDLAIQDKTAKARAR